MIPFIYSKNIRKFLGEALTIEKCKGYVREAMNMREETFLICAKKLIYENFMSPYRRLLEASHIGYLDLERLVRKNGIVTALQELKEAGVYITFEEFKGKKAVFRHNQKWLFKPKDFLNPRNQGFCPVLSGASRGSGTKISWGLDYLMQKAIHEGLIFDLHGCLQNPLAMWYPTYPAQTVLYHLRMQKLRMPIIDRFSQTKNWLPVSLYDKSILFLKHVYHSFFNPFYLVPKHVDLSRAIELVAWIVEHRNITGSCTVLTYVSSAIRICLAAEERGTDISGTLFFVAGEPLTATKRKEIEKMGCRVINGYYFTEGGLIGSSCFNSAKSKNDVHFFSDTFEMIQHRRRIDKLEIMVDAFLMTTLYVNTPVVMLNLENGDYGEVVDSKCHCPFTQYGFTRRIQKIKSHEKITAEGVTYYIGDMISMMEEVFPRIFGGVSIDYQLVEENDKNGLHRLTIYVNPRVGTVDEGKAKNVLFEGLSDGFRSDVRVQLWNQVQTLTVKSDFPIVTAGQKILPFYSKIV
jgi:hypothetical protein